jgi:hypothetical protein
MSMLAIISDLHLQHTSEDGVRYRDGERTVRNASHGSAARRRRRRHSSTIAVCVMFSDMKAASSCADVAAVREAQPPYSIR